MLRVLSSFVGFLLAITVSIFVFAPDRIPAGWGFTPTPVEINIGSNLGGELMSALTGQSDKNVRIKNVNDGTLYNVNIKLFNADMVLKKHYIKDRLPINNILTLGWAEQWDIQQGDQVSVSAATYQTVHWAL